VSKRTFGILAGIVGSAIGAWYFRGRNRVAARESGAPARDHGTVIFDNTPTAADTDAII